MKPTSPSISTVYIYIYICMYIYESSKNFESKWTNITSFQNNVLPTVHHSIVSDMQAMLH